MDKDQQHLEHHEIRNTDVFNFSGPKSYHVRLKLSLQAYILMREEYPKSIDYLIRDEDNNYYFIGTVHNLYGIGRFVLGLLDEMIILDPPELKAYVMDKLIEFQQLDHNREQASPLDIQLTRVNEDDILTE